MIGSRFDFDRYGPVPRSSPHQADLFINVDGSNVDGGNVDGGNMNRTITTNAVGLRGHVIFRFCGWLDHPWVRVEGSAPD